MAYARERCTASDTGAKFVLHLVPADPDDLPAHRKQHGFDNLDFDWGRNGGRVGSNGQCVVAVRLPDYPIIRIRAGQWIPAERRNLWQVEFEVGQAVAESPR